MPGLWKARSTVVPPGSEEASWDRSQEGNFIVFFSSGLLNFKNWVCGFLFIALNLIWWFCCVVVCLGGQISEYQIIEITENVCNLKKAEADWILLIDIVEQGNKLKVSIIYHLGLFLEQFDEMGIWKFVFVLGFISYLLWIFVHLVWQDCVFH